MTPYYVFYFLLLIVAVLTVAGYKEIEERKRLITTLFFVFLTVLLGLRHSAMGLDLTLNGRGYLYHFTQIQAFSFWEMLTMESYLHYEKGYVIFNWLVGHIWNNQHFFLFACAVVCIMPIAALIGKKAMTACCPWLCTWGFPAFFWSSPVYARPWPFLCAFMPRAISKKRNGGNLCCWCCLPAHFTPRRRFFWQ